MPDLTVSSAVDGFMQSVDSEDMRTASKSYQGMPIWAFGEVTGNDPAPGEFNANQSEWGTASFLKISDQPFGNLGTSLLQFFGVLAPEATDYIVVNIETGKITMLHGAGFTSNRLDYSIIGGETGIISGNYSFLPICKAAITLINGERGDGDNGHVTIDVVKVEQASGITPAADGTYPSPSSITIVKGIVTAIS